MTTAPESNLVKCSKCQAALYPGLFNLGELTPCPSCQSLLDVEVFPAILAAPTANMPERILVEGESSCYYHPANKASVVCEGCGRFVCGLCDLELNGRHVCPVCLEAGQKKGKFKDLENTRVRYDRMAVSLAILPLIFVWTSVIGSIAALYVVIRYWNAPCSVTGRSRAHYIVAAVLAGLELAVWAIIITNLIVRHHR